MPEPPLTDRELRILRGVIDEHLYRESRARFLGESWREGRAILVVVAGVVLFGLQIAVLVVALRTGHR